MRVPDGGPGPSRVQGPRPEPVDADSASPGSLQRALRLAIIAGLAAALAIPGLAHATINGGCTASGQSTSGSVDLTSATEWHLKSTDTAGGEGQSPAQMTSAEVHAYVLGLAIPIASGTGNGGTSGAVTGVSVAPFAILGHRFTVAGTASGQGACSGEITIILDDVNPALTAFGGGGLLLFAVGVVAILLGARSSGGLPRRILVAVLGGLGGAGLGVALAQFGVLDATSLVGLALAIGGLVLGFVITGPLGRGASPAGGATGAAA